MESFTAVVFFLVLIDELFQKSSCLAYNKYEC